MRVQQLTPAVIQHQHNNARIQALRAEADALDDQLASSVAALADLRRDLFATPATSFLADTRPVPFDELLRYAKNIAHHTVPPTYREHVPRPFPSEDAPAQLSASDEPALESDEKVVTAEEAEWLKKLNESNRRWFPWPDDDKIRRGNLMQIQYLLDTGKDATQVDLTKLAEDEKDRIAAEADRQAAAHAQSEAQAQAEPQELVLHNAPAPAPAPKPVEKKPVQTFTGFDDMEDDDDY